LEDRHALDIASDDVEALLFHHRMDAGPGPVIMR
jgi:hypothetical protein